MLHDTTVAFGPRQVLALGWARAEVVPSGPGRRGLEGAAVVVATTVVHIPAQRFGGPPRSIEVVAHRDLVERHDFGVRRAGGDRDGEGSATARVAVVPIRQDLRLEFGEHRHRARAFGVEQVLSREAVPPRSVDEHPFLRGVAEVPRVIGRLVVGAVGLNHAHVLQQLSYCGRLGRRHGEIVCAPGVGGHVIAPRPRVSAGLRLQLQQGVVVKPALGQFPRCRQPRHATTHDDHGHVARLARLWKPALA